ncbi:hypothetical protein S7335_5277 [Synechococcus sp. PCC 7335]|uniref:DUF5331 domain-containing protein n=1 Tax=Synechococcus sp. (strain ATCC 29403 / PCC 7335) TaxID=91464 RepID=UPI00017EB181|nr:DUF5331 domain-containing protein [Synechococcus sp. PCC 7335]EDX87567.1 hypothetical protein S7335_5277 [Synechococcus sp. PCC 7335]
MAFFENFTSVIRDKWLDYFRANRTWLEVQMGTTSVRTPEGGRRPSSFLILGVVNALEPKLSNLMVPFYQLNSDEDALIDVLGLNFDPEAVLDNGEVGKTIDASSEGNPPLLESEPPIDKDMDAWPPN